MCFYYVCYENVGSEFNRLGGRLSTILLRGCDKKGCLDQFHYYTSLVYYFLLGKNIPKRSPVRPTVMFFLAATSVDFLFSFEAPEIYA